MKRKAITLILSLLILIQAIGYPIAAEVLPKPIQGDTSPDRELQVPEEPEDEGKDLLSDNVHVFPNIAQSAWYTKLIDLSGYGNKAIEGKLRFRLEPDASAAIAYPVYDLSNGAQPSPEKLQSYLKIVPGKASYQYEVPFSSDDFVDENFNNLARGSAYRNGNTYELFNYAFLHEWGRVFSSDHGHTARVGKVYREQFQSEQDYQYALANYRVSWPGDPETHIMGWKCSDQGLYGGLVDESSLDCPIGSYEDGCHLLNEERSFQEGTYNHMSRYTLLANPAVTYVLAMITRPIAISKTYKDGNILSIEKPLLPSARAWDFLNKHEAFQLPDEDYDNETGERSIYIYRYRLTEEGADGIELSGDGSSIIVDVLGRANGSNIFMFTSEAEADNFYKRGLETVQKGKYGYVDLNESFYLGESAKIRLGNWLPRTSVSVNKVWKDDDNKNGKRPESIEVYLLADGEETGQHLTLDADNTWQGSFDDLNLYKYTSDNSGKISKEFINYSVREVYVPHYESHADMTKTLGKTDIVLTNTYTDDIVSLDIDKTWDDENDKEHKRPEVISVFLLKNGIIVDRRDLNAAMGWKTHYEDLPRYDQNGKEIHYSVLEYPIEYYEASYNGLHITNKLKPTEPSEPTTTCKPCEPSNPCNPSKPCNTTTPCNPGTILHPCEPHGSNDWPLTPKQKTPGIVTQTAESSQASSTQAPTAGMLPVTADGSFANVLYAALLLILAAAVTALRYEMKRRKEN